jgi:hypothetical protein
MGRAMRGAEFPCTKDIDRMSIAAATVGTIPLSTFGSGIIPKSPFNRAKKSNILKYLSKVLDDTQKSALCIT